MKAEKPKHIQELMNEALEPLRNAKGLRMKPDSGKDTKKPKLRFYCDKPACFAHYVANEKIKITKEEEKLDSGKNVKSLSEKGLLTPKGLMEKIENNFGSFTDMSPLGKNEWVFHGIGSIYVDDWLCLKEDFLRIESALAASEQRIKELEEQRENSLMSHVNDIKKLAQSLDWYKTCLERSQKREKDLQRQIAASEAKALQERNSKEYFMGQMNIHKKECAGKDSRIKELEGKVCDGCENADRKKLAEKDKEIKKLRQDAVQECCICGRYAPCNEVSIGGGVHFRCCSRDCLNKLFEHEDSLKEQALSELRDEIEKIRIYNLLVAVKGNMEFLERKDVLKAIDSRRTA